MIRKALSVAAFALSLTAASVASALSTGSATLTFDNGLFTNQGGQQSLSADFTFDNDLPGLNELGSYRLFGSLEINGATVFADSLDLGVTTLGDLLATPEAGFLALGLDFLLANPAGTVVITETDPDIDFDYLFTLDPGASFDFATGSFLLTSNQDYSAELAGIGVTAQSATWGAVIGLAAVPLPATLPLAAAGVLVFGFVARRRRSA